MVGGGGGGGCSQRLLSLHPTTVMVVLLLGLWLLLGCDKNFYSIVEYSNIYQGVNFIFSIQ